MPTLNINGKRIKVDDSFLKLSPEQQNAAVEEIASNIPGDFILPDLAGLEDVYIQATLTSATAANVLAELQT